MDISSFLERKIHWIIMGHIMEIVIFLLSNRFEELLI